MEQRLIDANAYAAEMKTRQDACKEIMDAAKEDENWEVYDRMGAMFSIFVEAKLTLDAMPTVDAVPVVRCGECVYRSQTLKGSWCTNSKSCCHGCLVRKDFYCADGERKDGESNV